MAISQAARDILAERARQVRLDGWTLEHDDEHECCELADAAACNALHASGVQIATIAEYWAFGRGMVKGDNATPHA
ncbi:hypothetical protein J8I87_23525 [Paraburkholderia sp. LEh10]|jgi:hypothetical protein|uniref:hypothetical protein n=1 Tax=Paraburkholderia sp. LEh10 TaxID=2821353 RepID=UPI001AE43AF6|nr:hypothetical protein [Paraburkholderia sp. LEh10]MBP0592652.1 hypothetical protein [Paraburkholderia sp. LEh10]